MATRDPLTPDELAKARQQLEGYRYTLDEAGRFLRNDRELGVVVTTRRGRFVAVSDFGSQLWAGADLGAFVAAFWHAEKAGPSA